MGNVKKRSNQKSRSSFTALVRPHLDALYRFAYRLTGHREDAQDLVQDVLLKVHSRKAQLQEVAAVTTWLRRVMYNQFIDDHRRYRSRRLRIVEDDELSADPDRAPAPQASTEDLAEGEFTLTRVRAALDQLGEDHRLVIVLHDVEGYTLTEMAEITGVSRGTLKSRRQRARERLQSLLDDGPKSRVFTSRDNRGDENDAL